MPIISVLFKLGPEFYDATAMGCGAHNIYDPLTMFTNWYCFGLLPFTASERNYCVSGHQLTRLIAVTVSSSAAGVAAGIIYAPILAARALCGKFARPAMLVGGAWCAVRGAWRLLKLRGMGPVALLRALASEDTREKLEALAKIAARAARSTSFRKAFIRYLR